MRAERRFAGVSLLVLAAVSVARAEAPKEVPFQASKPATATQMPVTESTLAQPTATGPAVQAYAPDSWVYQKAPDCCPPTFGGPIGTEIYLRSGPSFPVAGADFKKSLRTGWEVMGGGRSLFFSADGMRAWIVDLGLSYTINNAHPNSTFTYLDGSTVTMRHLHRTAVSLGLGHDWFMFGPGPTGANTGMNWRYGFDGGARWGTAHLDLNPINDPDGYVRTHDVYGAAFAAFHVDWEMPMGAWTFLMGLRGEWSYSFMDLLPNQSTTLHDINALLTIGVRW